MLEILRNVLLAIPTVYLVFGFFIGIIRAFDWIDYNQSPKKDTEELKSIETVGDLLSVIFMFYPVLVALIIYAIIKLFYNKYTISLMNIKIRKNKRR